MAQAGLHGLVGMAVKKMAGKKEWLLLGILLGSFIPDMDNLGVAVATVAKMPIAEGVGGIHRTLTHSVFFAVAVIAVFYFIGQSKKETRWLNLGLGLGLGIFLHSLLDLVLWFNGVALFWPIPIWINLWSNFPVPGWYDFMEPAEFLFFGLFLWALGGWARKFSTDGDFLKMNGIWMWLEFALFIVFTAGLVLGMHLKIISGAVYLFSLFMTFIVTIRMKKTVEAAA
jgi:membrane-bound metal-dependent hydrolase YbcI (DUF457 family)